MRQKATTGAPVRAEPKLGNACACLPSRTGATDGISAAVTTPGPPRPRILASKHALFLLRRFRAGIVGGDS
jgi:hypothetical protein